MNKSTPLVIATRNKGKTTEIRDLLQDFPVNIKNLADFGPIPHLEEDGNSFDENALGKRIIPSGSYILLYIEKNNKFIMENKLISLDSYIDELINTRI